MDKVDFYKVLHTRDNQRQRTPSTIPHQNAISDVHNQAMVAIRGKACTAVSVNAAERANRCAEVRLNNTKKHIDFMQHLDLVRLNREQVGMMDRLEKFKKSWVKIQTSKVNLMQLEKEALSAESRGRRSRGVFVPLPMFSEHSPRFHENSRLAARYAKPTEGRLPPMPGPSFAHGKLFRSAPATECSKFVFSSPELPNQDLSNPVKIRANKDIGQSFSRKLSVIPESPKLDCLRGKPSLQVVSFRSQRGK